MFIQYWPLSRALADAEASLTVGELLSGLVLFAHPRSLEFAYSALKICSGLMTEHFYRYSVLETQGKTTPGIEIPSTVKEQAVELVVSQQKATLEDALEHLGYRRNLAHGIFKDHGLNSHIMQDSCSSWN